ncbi:MAG: heme exporter protein CcmD [Commensalibacter sp.]|nr:heme exporter protein CcmD [Commensalibacter sp.]
MTHLPYIIAAYGISFLCLTTFFVQACYRLKRAQKRLKALQDSQ